MNNWKKDHEVPAKNTSHCQLTTHLLNLKGPVWVGIGSMDDKGDRPKVQKGRDTTLTVHRMAPLPFNASATF